MDDIRFDLISMADIARLAGQKRATVGNWKTRDPDFPLERGRSPRGPLYDRTEVTAWLEATNRLDARAAEVTTLLNLANHLRDGMRSEDSMPLLLLMLAVMSKAPDQEWRRVLNAPPSDLNDVLRASAHSLFPFADNIMPLDKLPAQSLARAVAMLSILDRTQVGVMADAVLEQAAKALGHRGSEFLSPPSVRKLVVAIAEPTGTIYNPATGVGQLMNDAATNATSKPIHVVGQEINRQTWAMARLNLAIHDITAEVALGDVFSQDHFPQLRADRVICVPPWNQRLPVLDTLAEDPRWVWGEPASNDSNAAWIQHCLSHLAEDGRAVMVLPNSALFEGGRAGRIRQRIVKAGLLDAVLSLPPGLFSWTSLSCAVLVFTKGRPSVGGKPSPTLMIDLAESESDQSSRTGTLENDRIEAVADIYRRWVKGQPPSAEYAAVASFEDLAGNDFVIDPGRYLSILHPAPDLTQAGRAQSELAHRLETLTQASRDADAALRALLGASR